MGLVVAAGSVIVDGAVAVDQVGVVDDREKRNVRADIELALVALMHEEE